MVFLRKIKWVIIILLLVIIGGWFYVRYTDRDFLRYGVLHIDKLPPSVHLSDYHTYGASDFHAEYYVSMNPQEFGELLQGRKYTKEKTDHLSVFAICAGPERDFFPAIFCYSSGSLKDGLVRIFTNADNTMALFVYDIN